MTAPACTFQTEDLAALDEAARILLATAEQDILPGTDLDVLLRAVAKTFADDALDAMHRDEAGYPDGGTATVTLPRGDLDDVLSLLLATPEPAGGLARLLAVIDMALDEAYSED